MKQWVLHKDLEAWLTELSPRKPILTDAPLGFRDLMWCPYLNEPAILEYSNNKPTCPNCRGNFEASTHAFLGHIKKPSWGTDE